VRRLCDESDAYTSPAADSSASTHSRTTTYSCANNSSPATSTGPVLHWSRGWVRSPLLFGRVVWRERIQLQRLRWQLVRRLFSGTNTSYTSGSGSDTGRQPESHSTGASAHAADRGTVLLGQHMRELRRGLVVQHGRECLHKLWRSLV